MTGSTMAPERPPATGWRAWTPTALTVGRIALAPLAAICIVLDSTWAGIAAFLLFLSASALDYFDGMLARKWNAVSEIGRSLDPIADKILVAAILIALAVDGLLMGWAFLPAIAIVGRDFLVSGLREYAMGAGRTLHVTPLAKWKTAAELAALALILAPAAIGPLAMIATQGELRMGYSSLWLVGVGLLWVAGALSVWTGALYTRSAFADPAAPADKDWE